MRRSPAMSTVGRVALVFTVAMVGMIVIGWGLHVTEKGRAVFESEIERLAERLSAPVLAYLGADPADRNGVLRNFRARDRLIWVGIETLPLQDLPALPLANFLHEEIEDQLDDVDLPAVRIGLADSESLRDVPLPWRRPGDGMRGRGPRGETNHMLPRERHMAGMFQSRVMVLAVQIPEGLWVHVAMPFQPFSAGAPFGFAFVPFAFFAFFLVIGLTIWAIWRAGRPLRTFSEAAERLGRDVNAEPMKENSGPREVRRAAQSFNEMQRRIRSFIEDRTRMLAAVSHDLRTPMTRLRLRAEFVEDPEQQARMLADLDEMEAMVAATLAFVRDDVASEGSRKVDLAALAAAVVDDFIETGATASYEGPDSFVFTGRPLALKRALNNLVGNAVKYAGNADVRFSTDGERVTICVDDDGPGIPEDHFGRIFDPFYRVESSRNRETGGSGLGLSVVRSVVGAHGGDVTLANRPTGGLSARITLPL